MHAERSDNILTTARRTCGRGFTIIELLVVIGIIGILATLTTLGARRLTASSRLAAGTNAVTNALGVARAAAIRDSQPTALVFRPVWDPNKPSAPQRVEMVVARSTGERVLFFQTDGDESGWADRFIPVSNVPAILLPEGIKVAGPIYDPLPLPGSPINESAFATQAELPLLVNCTESIEFNRTVAVLFGPQGEFITRPPNSSATLGSACGSRNVRSKRAVRAGTGVPDAAPRRAGGDATMKHALRRAAPATAAARAADRSPLALR